MKINLFFNYFNKQNTILIIIKIIKKNNKNYIRENNKNI